MTPTEQAARPTIRSLLAKAVDDLSMDRGVDLIELERQCEVAAIARHLAPGDDLVAQATAALEGVTPGPWRADGEPWNQIVWSDADNRVCFMAHSNGLDDDRDVATARFIAFTRQWVPEAAARISALTATVAEVENLKGVIDALSAVQRNLLQENKEARAENTTLRDRLARMEGALRDAKENGLIYWEPQNERGYYNKQLMLTRIDAALTDGGSNG